MNPQSDAPTPIQISNARYAKGKTAVRIQSDGTGWKTRAQRLASAKGIGGRWSNREKAYIMSQTAAQKLLRLFLAGWDTNPFTSELIEPEVQP